MRYIGIFLMCLVILPLNATKEVIRLGDSSVTLDWQLNGNPIFVHLHENETTAWQAVRRHLRQRKGSYLHLHQSGQRNICFKQNNKRFCFDPNRIFTDNGIKKTLIKYSQIYTGTAHRAVKKLSYRIKAIIGNRPVIAVHNNQQYSMRDYIKNHRFASEAQALHWHQARRYRDFLLITQKHLWPKITTLPHNAVLQSNNGTDDGSLSIWMAKRAYINCEAGYGHLSQQMQQLLQAEKLIG